jgi:hypothetical protein
MLNQSSLAAFAGSSCLHALAPLRRAQFSDGHAMIGCPGDGSGDAKRRGTLARAQIQDRVEVTSDDARKSGFLATWSASDPGRKLHAVNRFSCIRNTTPAVDR